MGTQGDRSRFVDCELRPVGRVQQIRALRWGGLQYVEMGADQQAAGSDLASIGGVAQARGDELRTKEKRVPRSSEESSLRSDAMALSSRRAIERPMPLPEK